MDASPSHAMIPEQASGRDTDQIGAPSHIGPGTDADRMVAALYRTHYTSLVRLAAVLVPDVTTVEEVVQDAFAEMHAAWPCLGGADRALPYLHHAVIRRCDALIRRGDASDPALNQAESDDIPSGVVSILRAMPARQREVVMLRFHADLSESQIASATGISKKAVRVHIARAMSALQAGLGGAVC
ncbi:MAG: sigma-70 family RNA polymerase sigma factor [Nocardiopsaceae bacterium]|jgi:RNA polymerase sigma factor (sigma-70 family)|nr:sigma-70 family RNA polymerase sigma factor [Nocardiopsaceae bacterium]